MKMQDSEIRIESGSNLIHTFVLDTSNADTFLVAEVEWGRIGTRNDKRNDLCKVPSTIRRILIIVILMQPNSRIFRIS